MSGGQSFSFLSMGLAGILLCFSAQARSADSNSLISSSSASSALIDGLVGSYASLNVVDGNYLYFTNSTVAGDGPGLMLYTGESLTRISSSVLIASNSLISDLKLPDETLDPSRMFTRPVVQYSVKDQRFYAVVHVTRGYPPKDGRVFPAFLVSKTSNPLEGWEYRGQMQGEVQETFGRGRSFTSGMAFLVNDSAASKVNHAQPMLNKFVFYNDFKIVGKKGGGKQVGAGLRMMYSADGTEWYFVKDESGQIADLRPPAYQDEKWIFASAVETPKGYFMYVSVDWQEDGPTGSRLLHSADGLNWKVIGMPPGSDGKMELEKTVGSRLRPKNVSLSYNAQTDEVYVIPTTTASDHTKSISVFKPVPQ